jgi:hypothetical protein
VAIPDGGAGQRDRRPHRAHCQAPTHHRTDNAQGPAAAFKRVFLIDLREVGADGFLVKREVANLLAIRDPHGISLPARPGDFGLGDPFSFPFQTIESILPLSGSRLLLADDNNFPFSAGRNPTRPDDTELIIVKVPALF